MRTVPVPDLLAGLDPDRRRRLTAEERSVLHSLAGSAAPAAGRMPRAVPPGVRRTTDRLADTPVAVCSAAWDLVQWNPAWTALFGDLSGEGDRDRNLVWRHFTGPESRVRHEGEQLAAHERELVADLRLASVRYPDDDLAALVGELHDRSPRFAALWERFEVAPRLSGAKTVVHPLAGELHLDCDVLTTAVGDLRLVVFTAAPGTADARALEQLLAGAAGLLAHRPERRRCGPWIDSRH